MKIRTLRRTQARRWDSVHKSWAAVEAHDYMWPIRYTKPCKSYTPWCSVCNEVKFVQVMGRFPRNIIEFNQFEEAQQAADPTNYGD